MGGGEDLRHEPLRHPQGADRSVVGVVRSHHSPFHHVGAGGAGGADAGGQVDHPDLAGVAGGELLQQGIQTGEVRIARRGTGGRAGVHERWLQEKNHGGPGSDEFPEPGLHATEHDGRPLTGALWQGSGPRPGGDHDRVLLEGARPHDDVRRTQGERRILGIESLGLTFARVLSDIDAVPEEGRDVTADDAAADHRCVFDPHAVGGTDGIEPEEHGARRRVTDNDHPRVLGRGLRRRARHRPGIEVQRRNLALGRGRTTNAAAFVGQGFRTGHLTLLMGGEGRDTEAGKDQGQSHGHAHPTPCQEIVGMTDRVLDEQIRSHGQHERQRHQQDVVHQRQGRLSLPLGGDGEDGPMPEVQGVRDQTEQLKRPLPQDGFDTAGGLRRSGGDDECGADHGKGHERSGVGGRGREDERRQQDRTEPEPRESGGDQLRQASQAVAGDGDESAQGELPRPREGREVGRRGVRRRHDDRQGVRTHDCAAEDDPEPGRRRDAVRNPATTRKIVG